MKKCFFIIAILVFCSSCAQKDQTSGDNDKISTSESEVVSSEINPKKDDTDLREIEALFSEIIADSAINTSLKNETIYVKIATNLAIDTAPDNWDSTIAMLEEALQAACEISNEYNAKTVFFEIDSSDENIMASGFDSKIRYNIFAEKTEESTTNSPTITKHEYDQISVGMSLSTVKEIIGGPGELQSQIGEVSEYSDPIRTYRWYGTKEGAYADILFDGYEVYSKVELWLE